MNILFILFLTLVGTVCSDGYTGYERNSYDKNANTFIGLDKLKIRTGSASLSFASSTQTTMMIMLSTGNFGIGTATPNATFHTTGPVILGDGRWPTSNFTKSGNRVLIDDEGESQLALLNTSNIIKADSFSQIQMGARATTSTNIAAMARIRGAKENATGGEKQSYFAIDTMNVSGTLSEKVRVDSAGRVGIGTNAPTHELEVEVATNSKIAIETTTSSALWELGSDASDHSIMIGYDGAANIKNVIRASGDNYITGGQFGVGTNNPIYTFQVDSSAVSDYAALIRNTDATGRGVYIQGGAPATGEPALAVSNYDGSSVLFKVDSDNRIGINTGTPLSPVHITTSAADLDIRMETSGSNDILIRKATDDLALFVGGSERVRVDSAGDVGIGTDTPKGTGATDLTISGGSGNNDGSLSFDNPGASTNSTLGSVGFYRGTTLNASVYGQRGTTEGQGYLTFYTSDGTLAERVRVDSSGNVGLRTASPQAGLHNVGTTILGDGNWPTVNFSKTGNRVLIDDVGEAQLALVNTSNVIVADTFSQIQMGARATTDTQNGAMARIRGAKENATPGNFASYFTVDTMTGGGALTEQVRVDSAGRIGIKTTTPGSYNSGGDQLVVYDATNAGVTVASGSQTALGSLYFADGITGNEALAGYIQYNHNVDQLQIGADAGSANVTLTSSNLLSVGSVGGVTAGVKFAVNGGTLASFYQVSSDGALKKDISDIEGSTALAVVSQLKPRTYKWKNKESDFTEEEKAKYISLIGRKFKEKRIKKKVLKTVTEYSPIAEKDIEVEKLVDEVEIKKEEVPVDFSEFASKFQNTQRVGFIAQEVCDAVPSACVKGAVNGYIPDALVPVNTAAIKEMHTMILTLQAEVADLRARVEVLEAQ